MVEALGFRWESGSRFNFMGGAFRVRTFDMAFRASLLWVGCAFEESGFSFGGGVFFFGESFYMRWTISVLLVGVGE